MYIYINTYICVYLYSYIYKYLHIYTYICIYIFMCIHMYLQIYICIYLFSQPGRLKGNVPHEGNACVILASRVFRWRFVLENSAFSII